MKKISLLLIPLAIVIVVFAVWGPEALAQYRDNSILNQVHTQEAESGLEGFRYSLSANEKLYILAKCLSSQVLPESEHNAMTRPDSANMDYQELMGTYAFVANRKDASGQEVLASLGIDLCNKGIKELKVQYSAIDVPEPRNNVLVWKISLNTATQNANKKDRLLDAYVDADTGKIYEFYVRTEITSWAEIDADNIVRVWAEYMGLDEPVEYTNTNPLTETTPYFKKYSFAGMEANSTIVTVGFYDGINELFLKVSQ